MLHQIVDARHIGVRIAETHDGEQFRNVDFEVERVFVRRALGFGLDDADRCHGGALRTVVEGLHGRETSHLCSMVIAH